MTATGVRARSKPKVRDVDTEASFPSPGSLPPDAGPCPANEAISAVSDKWKIVIVMTLVSVAEPVRFARLQRLLGNVSRKVLTAALRGLEADGLVTRTVYPEVPPRVEYAVTEAGLGLVPIVRQLDEWWRERERLAAQPQRPKLVALP